MDDNIQSGRDESSVKQDGVVEAVGGGVDPNLASALKDQLGGKRVTISGSRDFPHLTLVSFVVRLLDQCGVSAINVGFDPLKRTPRGVDATTYDTAIMLGMTVHTYPPKWIVNGMKNMDAGLRRNIDMVNESDYTLCFWNTVSRGTSHALVYAHQMGKLFRVYSPSDKTQDPEELLKLAYKVRRVQYAGAENQK